MNPYRDIQLDKNPPPTLPESKLQALSRGGRASGLEGLGRQTPPVLALGSYRTSTNAIGDIVCERRESTSGERSGKAGITLVGKEPRGSSKGVSANPPLVKSAGNRSVRREGHLLVNKDESTNVVLDLIRNSADGIK